MSVPTSQKPDIPAPGARSAQVIFMAGLAHLAALVGFMAGFSLIVFPLGAVIGDNAWLWLPSIPTALICSYFARRLAISFLVRRR